MPAAVILHGAAGILPYVTERRSEFAAMGVATFIVDSFTRRNITSTISDQERLARLNVVLDAYRALALLRSHPRIDPDRIVVVGFSRGGDVALYSAMRRFQDLYGRAGSGFAAHAAFYPNCGTKYVHDRMSLRSRSACSTEPPMIMHRHPPAVSTSRASPKEAPTLGSRNMTARCMCSCGRNSPRCPS